MPQTMNERRSKRLNTPPTTPPMRRAAELEGTGRNIPPSSVGGEGSEEDVAEGNPDGAEETEKCDVTDADAEKE